MNRGRATVLEILFLRRGLRKLPVLGALLGRFIGEVPWAVSSDLLHVFGAVGLVHNLAGQHLEHVLQGDDARSLRRTK